MNPLYPIYTEKTECQDCYKCVRSCPIKAIKIEDGHAAVISELCILCGQCVNVCPMGAKKGRDDNGRAKQLLKRKEKVIVSLAPSYVSEFDNIDSKKMISALKKLGFYAVSETAYGAEEVSAHVAELIAKKGNDLFISSACPTVVKYITKYRADLANKITPFLSPVLTHCKLLRQEYGEDIGIIFISPCLAKKEEADENPQLLDLALTFNELKNWFDECNINIEEIETDENAKFVPRKIHEGSLYPIDGGMIEGIKANLKNENCNPFYFAVSGIDEIDKALKNIQNLTKKTSVFLELLACEGGCINGPMMKSKSQTGVKRYNIIDQANYNNENKDRVLKIDISQNHTSNAVNQEEVDEEEIIKALNSLGKFSEKDELNCGGCGYDSCRDLAKAYLDGRAERTMCVSYMRKLAHKKANLLLNTMPSGVVIVNKEMKVVECNRNFAALIGKDTLELFDSIGELANANFEKIAPFSNLFKQVLENANDTISKEVKLEDSILQMTIFTIEKHHLVGGIMQDITNPAIQKQRVIEKAEDVIQKNLETVQKIAYLLGENAAESEVILSSIIETVKKR